MPQTADLESLGLLQADLKHRADELEKKTAGVDLLNRKAEKIRAAQDGGPEAGGAQHCITVETAKSAGVTCMFVTHGMSVTHCTGKYITHLACSTDVHKITVCKIRLRS